MKTQTLRTIADAFALLDRIGGDIFTAEFIKKDGTARSMNARRGVRKHLAGGTMAYEPRKRDLLPVYDMKTGGYRMVNVATLRTITHGGIRYVTSY